MSSTGWVFNIQRFSLHDGPGIRTTVFLKGCPLRCRWCHNPEGLAQEPQIRLAHNLCTHCGRCREACPQGGHEVTAESHGLHLEHCLHCAACAQACPYGALELVGSQMTVDDVLAVVVRDRPFYTHSGGGMTLSGGEPMAQFAFSRDLLQAAKHEGLHTAIETSALTSWTRLSDCLPLVDLFLVDLKHTDDARHRALTGVSNHGILTNIGKLSEAGANLILRIPWVPTQNAEEEFLEGLIEFLASLPSAPSVEFMPYHRLGIGKWSALGGVSTMPDDIPAATADEIAPWIDRLHRAGFTAKVS